MDLVISIKSKYLNKIREGSKIWELRKSLPVELLTQGKIGKIWIWETAPVSKIVGYFDFSFISTGSIEQIRGLNKIFLIKDKDGYPIVCESNVGEIERYYHNFGTTEAEFDTYFKKCENRVVYALFIANWVERPIDLDIKPPQNYVFVNKDKR